MSLIDNFILFIIYEYVIDPAAEFIDYEPAFDVRDLINLQTAMEELNYGPNGGLVFCMVSYHHIYL